MAITKVRKDAETLIVKILQDQYGQPARELASMPTRVARDIVDIFNNASIGEDAQKDEIMVCIWMSYSDKELAEDAANKVIAALV